MGELKSGFFRAFQRKSELIGNTALARVRRTTASSLTSCWRPGRIKKASNSKVKLNPRPIISTKFQFLLILNEMFSQTNRFTNLYAKTTQEKTWSLIHGLSRFFDYWPLQKKAIPPTLGKTLLKCCTLKILRSKLSFFFITCKFLWKKSWIDIKCIFYECWTFF